MTMLAISPSTSERDSIAAAERLTSTVSEHVGVLLKMSEQWNSVLAIASEMTKALAAGKKILWFGNGGSAADSQHLAAELVGRFRRERRPLPSVALTTDTSVLTAIANDYGYNEVFRRQVEALCEEGDVVVGLSTSGNSPNVVLALERARQIGAFTVAMTGSGGGQLRAVPHTCVSVPSTNTARIQEVHIFIGHFLCDHVESELETTTA